VKINIVKIATLPKAMYRLNAKRAMLEASQYLILKYTTQPKYKSSVVLT
jgi:hypothetical protein